MDLNICQWDRAVELARQLCDLGQVPAISFQLQRHGLVTPAMHFGTSKLHTDERPTDDTLFLIASLTKPMVAMAVMLLVERGELALNQRVATILPEFNEPSKRSITIRNLLTHTSGLPDMLPNNQELREQHASLNDFVNETIQTDLVFTPGRGAQYQSMGYALLGPIIESVSGRAYQQFLREELFEPLDMHNTWLGLTAELLPMKHMAEVRVPTVQQAGTDWNWNSDYWKQLGAPWGGGLSTAADLSKFCRWMLTQGKTQAGEQLLSAASVRISTTNRLHDYPLIAEVDRRTRGWGFGWRMNWLEHRGAFSDLLGPEVYGHWGATGTLFWIDPSTNSALVILSTEPMDREISPLVMLSNAITAAL